MKTKRNAGKQELLLGCVTEQKKNPKNKRKCGLITDAAADMRKRKILWGKWSGWRVGGGGKTTNKVYLVQLNFHAFYIT